MPQTKPNQIKPNLSIKKQKNFLRNKEKTLYFYVPFLLIYASEKMKRKLEALDIWFYRKMLSICWLERLSGEEVLGKNGNNTEIYTKNREVAAEIFCKHNENG